MLEFLCFDRSAFWEFIDEETPYFLCSVAVRGVEPPMRGPIPVEFSWLPASFVHDVPSLFDQAKTSRRRQPPPRNIIAALVFAPCMLFRCLSVVAAIGRPMYRPRMPQMCEMRHIPHVKSAQQL